MSVGDGVAVAVFVGVAVGSRLVMVYTAPSLLKELSQVGSPNTQLSEAPSWPGLLILNQAHSVPSATWS